MVDTDSHEEDNVEDPDRGGGDFLVRWGVHNGKRLDYCPIDWMHWIGEQQWARKFPHFINASTRYLRYLASHPGAVIIPFGKKHRDKKLEECRDLEWIEWCCVQDWALKKFPMWVAAARQWIIVRPLRKYGIKRDIGKRLTSKDDILPPQEYGEDISDDLKDFIVADSEELSDGPSASASESEALSTDEEDDSEEEQKESTSKSESAETEGGDGSESKTTDTEENGAEEETEGSAPEMQSFVGQLQPWKELGRRYRSGAVEPLKLQSLPQLGKRPAAEEPEEGRYIPCNVGDKKERGKSPHMLSPKRPRFSGKIKQISPGTHSSTHIREDSGDQSAQYEDGWEKSKFLCSPPTIRPRSLAEGANAPMQTSDHEPLRRRKVTRQRVESESEDSDEEMQSMENTSPVKTHSRRAERLIIEDFEDEDMEN